MKKLLTVVITLLLAGSLAFAQNAGASDSKNQTPAKDERTSPASSKKQSSKITPSYVNGGVSDTHLHAAEASGKKVTKTRKAHEGSKKDGANQRTTIPPSSEKPTK